MTPEQLALVINQTAKAVSTNKVGNLNCSTLKGKENYEIWSYTVKSHLESIKLDDCIMNDDSKGSDRGLQAKSIILSTLSESMIGSVLSCKTAREIWLHLKTALGVKSSNEKRDLWVEINTLKAASAKEVPDIMNKLLTCKGKLKTLMIEIEEQHAISALTQALPGNFKSFIET